MNTPRVPMFTLHSHALLETAIESAEKMKDGKKDVLNSIIMSATAAEAFINEAQYMSTLSGKQPYQLNAHGRLPVMNWSFREKYEEVLRNIVPGFSWHKEPYSNLSLVYGLRNTITHLNHIDEFAENDEDSPTEILLPTRVQPFEKLNLLKKVPKESWINWFELIQTSRLAWWVCKTTRDSITQILIDSPQDFSRYFEPWRNLAIRDLPTMPLEKKLGNKLKVASYAGNGRVVYQTLEDSKVVFSSAHRDAISSINAADDIVNSISHQEDLPLGDMDFYDLRTCMGYRDLKSGEYELLNLKVSDNEGQLEIAGWNELQKLRYLEGALHLFEKDEVPESIQNSLQDFSQFIGKPYPF